MTIKKTVKSTAARKSVATKKDRDESKYITPAAADRLTKGRWFTGYASKVRRADSRSFTGDFDESFVDDGYVVFDGLSVSGLLETNMHRAIIAVVGDLSVGRLVLGDAVLVVTGKVTAREFVAVPFNEGVFSVHGQQKVDKLVAFVTAPWLLVADRSARETRLFARKGAHMVEVEKSALDPALLDDGELDYRRVFGRLAERRSPLVPPARR